MNKSGRKEIQIITNDIDALRNRIITLSEQEQEKYENMPESLQNSAKGELIQEIIEALDSAISSIDEATDYLDTAKGTE